MADKVPLKAVPDGSAPTSIGEFEDGDTVPVEHGGTGQTTALTAADVGAYSQAEIAGLLGDKADLGIDGKIVTSELPSLVITDVSVVNSEAAQLALIVQQGDVCIRTDLTKTFIALNDSNLSMADWVEVLTPAGGVISVNGETGAVTLSYGDVGAAAATHSHGGDDITSAVANATDADKLDGYHANAAVVANTVPLRNASGDIFVRFVNCTAGASTTAPTRVYASYDTYMRYMTPAEFSKHLTPTMLTAPSGTTIRASDLTEYTSGSTVYVKAKELKVPHFMALATIKTSFALAGTSDMNAAYARIYIDGVAVGTERSVWSTLWTTFTEDLTVQGGVVIELWVHAVTAAAHPKVKDFKLMTGGYANTVPPATW